MTDRLTTHLSKVCTQHKVYKISLTNMQLRSFITTEITTLFSCSHLVMYITLDTIVGQTYICGFFIATKPLKLS